MIARNREIQKHPLKADVLLVTATEVEARAVLDVFGKVEKAPALMFIADKGYYDLGMIAGARTFMIQSEMGVGTLLTLRESLEVLSPSVLIIVGIAFGLKPEEQQLGDILVSTRLESFELQRLGEDAKGQSVTTLHKESLPISKSLLERFKVGSIALTDLIVHFGPILSGTKFTDNQDYRNQLLEIKPDAIGGEMEGAGLFTAPHRYKIDCILVKAICDWADGLKILDRAVQQKAAHNAALFTLYVLQQGGFERAIREPSSLSQTFQSSHALGTTLRTYGEHSNWVLSAAWEPNGSRIASAGSGGAVHIWNADTGSTLLTYLGHQHRSIMAKTLFLPTIYNVVWSPTEPRVASGGDGKEIHIWNADTGGINCIYRGHSGLLPNIFAIDWSPDGKSIASACSSASIDKTIHIWDAENGQLIRRCATTAGSTPNFSVLALAWSPDGSRIAATCDNHIILLLNPHTGERITSYSVSAPWTSHLAWSSDSRFLATANSDATVQIWDTFLHKLVLAYSGHSDSVRAVAWSSDGEMIASASNDKTVQLWNPTTGKTIFIYRRHFDWTTDVTWSPNGRLIASASNDKTVHVWQAV